MTKYNVLVDIVGTASVMVEADNEADAEEVAIEAVTMVKAKSIMNPLAYAR